LMLAQHEQGAEAPSLGQAGGALPSRLRRRHGADVRCGVGRSDGFGLTNRVGVVEADERDALDARVLFEGGLDRGDRDRRRGVDRVTVGAGADRREGDGSGADLGSERVAIATGERGVLIVAAAPPDGADGVDYPARGQASAAGDTCLAG